MKTTIKLLLVATTGLSLTACVTALEKRPADQIAAKAYHAVDSYTGLRQTRLPYISPFKWSGNVSGTAQLQTAEAFEGANGGAWLDVMLTYNTPSNDPAEMRVYNKIVWGGGQAAKLADFSAAVLTCSESISEYNNNRGYGGGYGYGGGHYGDYGYGHGYGHGYGGDGSGHGGGSTPTPTPTPTPHPDTGTSDPSVTGAPTALLDPFETIGRYGPGTGPTPTRDDMRRKDVMGAGLPTPVSRRRPATISRPAPTSRPPARPSPAPTTKTKRDPVSVSKPAKSKSKSRPSRREIRDKIGSMFFQDESQAVQMAAKETNGTLSHRPYPSTYGTRHRRGYNYGHYGRGYGYGDREIVIRTSCARREKLRVFVPKERLLDAEHYGMTLYIRGKSGDERPLVITPNYVMAYQMASRRIAPAQLAHNQ
ncbi:MAG: hypothetical protein V3U82_03075 [Robiginitomaculum sp.]